MIGSRTGGTGYVRRMLCHGEPKLSNATHPLERGLRCRSGATAVEFAIILPVFIATIMGLIEFGHLFWNQVSLRYAVEQTARNAMAEYTRESFVNADFQTWYANWTPTLEAAVPDEVFGWDPSGATFTATTAQTGGVEYLTVDAAYTFQFTFLVIPGYSSLNLTATSRTPLIGDW